MTWPQILTSVAGAVTAGAVSYGAIVASKGINAWRRETLGKRKIEMAERAIHVFARARGAIREARNPYVPAGELVEVYRAFNDGKDPEDVSKFGGMEHSYYAHILRLQRHHDTFMELESLAPLFMAYFGDDAEAWFEAIKKAYIKIGVTADILVRMARQGQLDRSKSTVTKSPFQNPAWSVFQQINAQPRMRKAS